MEKKKQFALLGFLMLIAALAAPAPAGADVTELNNGETVPVTLAAGKIQYCYLQLPGNITTMRVRLYDMDGDLDLYTRHGAWPDATTYDCRPYNDSGTDETCYFTNPAAGIWYFLIHGYTAGSAYLSVTYETASTEHGLDNGESISVTTAAGKARFFSMEVPANARDLNISLTGMSGDLDLYTRYGSRPTTGAFDCRPYLGRGRNETCRFSTPAAGTWYFAVNGYTSGSATLTASYSTPSSARELENGTPLPLTLEAGRSEFFSIQVPAGATSLSVVLEDMNGDLDLYTRFEDYPGSSDYECRPYLGSGSPETCVHRNPSAGTWYIGVHGYTRGSARLTATYTTDAGPGADSGELPPDKQVWSSWYWPWDDANNPNLYDSDEALHRYDQVTGSTDARGWEYANHGPMQNPADWWGFCHAWSSAACWHPQPEAPRNLNGVQFRIRDLKGLMTAAYADCGHGEFHEINAYRPSPGAFWRLLQDEIKGRDPMHGQPRALIADVYYGDEIWNHPIYAYEVNYSGGGTVSGTIQVRYPLDTSPQYADSTFLVYSSLTYRFTGVRMNGTVPSDSGQWVVPDNPDSLPHHRPDIVWRPYKASNWSTYAANPHLTAAPLKAILGSVNQ